MEAVATAVQTLGEQGYGRSPPSMGSRDGVSVTGCLTNQITRGGGGHGILIAAGAPPPTKNFTSRHWFYNFHTSHPTVKIDSAKRSGHNFIAIKARGTIQKLANAFQGLLKCEFLSYHQGRDIKMALYVKDRWNDGCRPSAPYNAVPTSPRP